MHKTRGLFILPGRSTFSELDKKLISRFMDLDCHYLEQNASRAGYLIRSLKACFKIIFGRKRLVMIWFADYHAALAVAAAKMRRMKSLIFVGGYDAVCYPELGMGVYCSLFRGTMAGFALRHCDLIIANHEALLDSSNTYYQSQGHPEGVYRLVPKLKTPSKVIYNAITISTPDPATLQDPRSQRFLCVGTTPRYQDIINKGYDLVAKVAKLHPELNFEIVGLDQRWQSSFVKEYSLEHTHNLKLHGYLPHREVLELMRSSRWFIQASISEGMHNALMEAMAMGCIAIGSRVAGIPAIIGDKGILFDSREVDKLEKAIAKAQSLSLSPNDISDSIVDVFSQPKRENELKYAILGLLGSD